MMGFEPTFPTIRTHAPGQAIFTINFHFEALNETLHNITVVTTFRYIFKDSRTTIKLLLKPITMELERKAI